MQDVRDQDLDFTLTTRESGVVHHYPFRTEKEAMDKYHALISKPEVSFAQVKGPDGEVKITSQCDIKKVA